MRKKKINSINPSKAFRYELWINVYQHGSNVLHATREIADQLADTENRIACVKVVVEGKEGDGL